jgi:hypothetical protein
VEKDTIYYENYAAIIFIWLPTILYFSKDKSKLIAWSVMKRSGLQLALKCMLLEPVGIYSIQLMLTIKMQDHA